MATVMLRRCLESGLPSRPAGQHDRHFEEHADHRCQRRATTEIEQVDSDGHSAHEEIGSGDQRI